MMRKSAKEKCTWSWGKAIVVVFGCFWAMTGKAQSLAWSAQVEPATSGHALATGVAIDDANNAYVVGEFSETVDLDPGAAVDDHTSAGSLDGFLIKLNGSGDLVMAQTFGGSGATVHLSTIVVSGNGEAWLAGTATGSVDMDPGPTTNLVSFGAGPAVFLCKYSVSGELDWVRSFGAGASSESCGGIAIDPSGNCILVGGFSGAIDLDPSIGSDIRTSVGGTDGFVVKLDPAGNLLWGTTVGNVATDECKAVVCDPMGGVYVAGMFIGSVDFEPGPGVTNFTLGGSPNLFLLKLTDDGAFVRVSGVGGSFEETPTALAIGEDGSVYMGGVFSGPTDFDPGPSVFSLSPVGLGARDAFCMKVDAAGTFQWARSIGSVQVDHCAGITLDDGGNVCVVGSIGGSADLDPGPAVDMHASAGGRDGFVVSLSSSGAYQWGFGVGGIGHDDAKGVGSDAFCNPIVVGGFMETIDLDPGPGVAAHTSSSGFGTDGFVQALVDPTAVCDGTTLGVEWISIEATAERECVVLRWQTGVEWNNEGFAIERRGTYGDFVEIGHVAGNGSTNTTFSYSWCDKKPITGVAYYRIRQVDHDGTSTVSGIVAIEWDPGIASLVVREVSVGVVHVKTTTNFEGAVAVRIWDPWGRVVHQQTRSVPSSTGEVVLQVGDLYSGVYTVEMDDGRQRAIGRWVHLDH